MRQILQLHAALRASMRTTGTLGALLLLVAGCSATEPHASSPVALRLGSSVSPSATSTASSPLQISAVRLVVTNASLGNGEEFGCVDCEGDVEDAPATPKVITVPLDGGTVLLATEQAQPGIYSDAEITVEQPGAALLAGTSGWPSGATILVEGTYNGAAFKLPLSIVGTFHQTLNPPLTVSVTGAPATVAIVISLPIRSWFDANGSPLDPNDPAQQATIAANARRSFQPLEEPASRER